MQSLRSKLSRQVFFLRQQQSRIFSQLRYFSSGFEDDEVPEIFREHRHTVSSKPTDLDAFKRQVYYRCRHIGTKELEIVIGDWLQLNMQGLQYKDMEEFDENVLNIENPQL